MKRFVLTLTVIAAAAIPANASIALFVDGRSMKIDSYAVAEDQIHLTMQTGTLSVPLTRIERIVDDEITTPAVVAEVQKSVDEGVFPRRSWRYSEHSRPLFRSNYNDIIIEASRHHDVDAALVSAVIKAESDYNPKIVSHKGARGLMQLMPATAKRFGVTNSFDPKENIYGGTKYLRWLLKRFEGNADLAVAAYNAGEGNIAKYDGVPPFRETVNYIGRIAKHIRKAISEQQIPRDTEDLPVALTSASMMR
jgi:hypothetical protein